MARHFSLTNKTRGTLPRVPFKKIKEEVLGEEYDLSFALIPPKHMQEVTLRTKHKDKVSNVLSFPLSKHSGEILICPTAAKPHTVGYLFIHGVLHLKGLQHGVTMENAEQKLLARFSLCKKSLPE